MSHIARIELEIKSLEDLKSACNRLGLKFCENEKSYKWFGRWVGDEPLPEDVREEDLGKCDHMIHVPGAQYQIGIVKKDSQYRLLWDSWQSGGLEKILGRNAGLLKQAYAVETIKRESRLKGHRLRETMKDNKIRLVLNV